MSNYIPNKILFITILCIFCLIKPVLSEENNQYYFSLTKPAKHQKNFKHFDYINNNAPKGGGIVFGIVGNFDNLNPHILLGNSGSGLELTYESLMERNADELGVYYPLIAEYFIINSSNNSISFVLRSNIHFSDDSKLLAEDIAFSYDILTKKGHPFYRISLKGILSYNIENSKKITFYLKNINNKDLISKLITMPILSKKYYQDKKFNKITDQAPLGSGAYIVTKVILGKYIIYQKNLNHWGKNLNINIGRYNFEKIKYNYYRDAIIAIQALKAGEYDVRFENIARNWAKSYSNNDNINKIIIKHSIPTGMQAFIFNLRNKNFLDIRVRKAFNLAFDFEWINKNLFYSSYKRIDSFFENSIYQAKKNNLTEFEKEFLEKNNYIAKKYQNLIYSIKNKDSLNLRNNLKKARNLLEEGGWSIKDFVLQNKNGEKFTVEFLVTSPSMQRVILPYIKNLEKLGIMANIRIIDYSSYSKRLENFDFEITTIVLPGVILPGNNQEALFHSKYAKIKGSRNLMGTKDPLIDLLVTKISKENNNFIKKQKLTILLDRILRNNFFVIPHWYLDYFRIASNKKFEYPKNTPKYGLDVNSWYRK